MSLLAFGVNHKTAPVKIREKVAFAPERVPSALQELTSREGLREAAILSTCNRTELYCGTADSEIQVVDYRQMLLEWFCSYHQLDVRRVEPYIYLYPDQSAVRQIMRVASGLDSLVLGEPQILGQMKQAYLTAHQAGTIGSHLNRLFQHTFSVAKRVRTDTAIGASPVSVAFAAVSLAKQFFSNLDRHTALLIGAGETTELVARHLRENGIGRIIIANRTVEKAYLLANEVDGYAIGLPGIKTHLAEADLVVSSTASPEPVITREEVEQAVKSRKRRPILMIDIAVPRDIAADASEVDDIYLYTVDDLQDIIQEGLRSRQEAAKQADEIIDTHVSHFMGWLRSLSAVGTIRSYRENAEQIRDEVLEKARRHLAAGHDPEQVLQELAYGLTNKLIHTPTAQMSQAAYAGRNELLEAARELFKLDKTDES